MFKTIKNQWALYYHTLRYLKPQQILYRCKYHIYRPILRKNPDNIYLKIPHKKPFFLKKNNALKNAWRFEFLNQSYKIEKKEDWNHPHWPKLWLYHLHYFDDLSASPHPLHLALLKKWIAENPPASKPGWEAYPLSRRIVNWIKWHLTTQPLDPEALENLFFQTQYLSKSLEYHLLANHLLANAKALLFAGIFFEGEKAQQWKNKACKIISTQLTEQILNDGGHFERSPMYHCLLLEDMLDIIHLFSLYHLSVPSLWIEKTQLMLRWLTAFCHPDEHIVLFNDAAFNMAPSPQQLFHYAQQLNIHLPHRSLLGLHFFKDSGFVRLAKGDLVAFLDLAPLEPYYNPGHAHASTLSFELSWKKQRLFVNSGTETYEANERRQFQRSTAAHNTATIDDQNSSQVWKSFRVGRRAQLVNIQCQQQIDFLSVTAAHTGYQQLPGKPTHQRQWQLTEKQLMVIDTFLGKGFHFIHLYFHLHPNCFFQKNASSEFYIFDAQHQPIAKIHCDPHLAWTIQPTEYYPEFGLSMINQTMVGHIACTFPRKIKTIITFQ